MCDRDMTSSPDDTVVRSSTEDHVVESPRDVSVADHHAPDPVVGRESSDLQDVMDAEPSVQNRHLQHNNNLLVGDQQTRVRPMSSRVYNPLPFKKRFFSAPHVEDVVCKPSEIVSPPVRQCIVDVNLNLTKRVSPTSPRIFSPVPYSRHCNSYSPVNWQNPSVNNSPTELVPEEDQTNDGHNSVAPICKEEKLVELGGKNELNDEHIPVAPECVGQKTEESVCVEEVKLKDEKDIKAVECLEEKGSSTDNQITTDEKFLEEKMVKDVQKSSDEPVDCEASDKKNATESSCSDEWLIDQHSPTVVRSLIDEWTKKRSEDYQKTLKRPLTAIPEHDVENNRSTHFAKSSGNALDDNPDDINGYIENDVANERKSSLRDNLEEFVKLEKHFFEGENRRPDQLINMEPNEKKTISESLKCAKEVKVPSKAITEVIKEEQPTDDKEIKKTDALKENNETEEADGVPSECNPAQIDISSVGPELVNKVPLRDSLEEFVELEKYFMEEEKSRNDQLIDMKPSEEPDGSSVTKSDTDVKKPSIVGKVIDKFKAKRKTKAKKKKETAAAKEKAEDSKEMEDLKKAFEEQLKEKQEFEKLIEKQEKDLKGQLREMDEVMENVQTEHAHLEKVTKDFSDTMKVRNNNENEGTRSRLQVSQQEISLSILQSENSDLEKELRDLHDNIEDIHERRSLGLDRLKQKLDEVKREVEAFKEESNEIEGGTKKKMTEFNDLRMTVMEKGITYVKKGTIVKGAVGGRLPKTTGCRSSTGFNVGISNIDNIPPDLRAPRVNTPDIRPTDKAPKNGSNEIFDDDDDDDDDGMSGNPDRLSGAREERTKIPKPTYKIYGSYTRDSERYTDEDSLRMVEKEDYNRDSFVKESERDALFDYIDPAIERVSATIKQIPKYNGDTRGRGYYDFWSKNNVTLDKSRKGAGRNDSLDARQSIRPVQKQGTVPKRINKKEIKSKIDTGLKNRPGNRNRSVSSHRNDAVKTNVPSRNGTVISRRREVSSANAKTQSLPPLKKAQNESDVPRSPTFDSKAPLPGIQQANQRQQRNGKKNVPEKKAVPPRVLPPIKSANAGRLPTVEKKNKQLKVVPKKKTPTAMWVSFSPTPPHIEAPPTNGAPPTYRARSTRRRRSADAENISQDDGKRVWNARA